MNEDHVLELPKPGPADREKALRLIGKVIIDGDDRFTQEEIEIARETVNVADFLAVIAGHLRPGEPQDLAYAALVYQSQGGDDRRKFQV
jgi:hypothetical protein